jgi:hypothetical protein
MKSGNPVGSVAGDMRRVLFPTLVGKRGEQVAPDRRQFVRL